VCVWREGGIDFIRYFFYRRVSAENVRRVLSSLFRRFNVAKSDMETRPFVFHRHGGQAATVSRDDSR